jgi:hypothetical protein
MDQHVPRAVTEGLRRRGVDVLTAEEDGAAAWADDQLLTRAEQLGRVLFSQDDDLLAIAHEWQQTGRAFAGLVYAHQLNITIGQAVSSLELIAKAMDLQDMRNRIEFIPF